MPEEEYRSNLEEIAARIKVLGAIPVFQTYYKMDLEAMEPEWAKGFVRNMEIVRELAAEHNWNFVDQGITKNLKSPQGNGKNGRKSQNLGRFSELFRQNRPLGGF